MGAQSAEEVHDVGQDADAPLQTKLEPQRVPAGKTVQVPTDPDTLQASQAPPHAVSQHTPSTQLPLAQLLPALQAVPFALPPPPPDEVTQAPELQVYPTAQPALDEHDVGHEADEPEQTYAPSVPHVVDDETSAHEPTKPATLHESHEPLQASLQQTPSEQNPEAHVVPELQDVPLALPPPPPDETQLPDEQV